MGCLMAQNEAEPQMQMRADRLNEKRQERGQHESSAGGQTDVHKPGSVSRTNAGTSLQLGRNFDSATATPKRRTPKPTPKPKPTRRYAHRRSPESEAAGKPGEVSRHPEEANGNCSWNTLREAKRRANRQNCEREPSRHGPQGGGNRAHVRLVALRALDGRKTSRPSVREYSWTSIPAWGPLRISSFAVKRFPKSTRFPAGK